MLVILIEIGTPPVGLNLFTINAIVPGLTSVMEVARGSLPFVFLLLLGVALLNAFPQIALWLPSKNVLMERSECPDKFNMDNPPVRT